MAVKIYLSASNQIYNPCKMGDSESDHCNLYLDHLEPLLRASGFEVKRAARNQGIREMVAESNAWGADLHLVNHTNASNGSVRGSRTFISGKWEETRKLAETIQKYRRQVYPAGGGIYTNNTWYEMANVKAYCVYEELVFHDNEEDAAWFHENMALLAQATAKALCEHYGYTYQQETMPPEGGEETVYTVVQGDTLASIAKQYGTTYPILAEYNGLSNPSLIYAGQKIRIPNAGNRTDIRVGDQIRVKQGAKTYDGATVLANFVYQQTYEVLEISGDRVVIGRDGIVTAAVKMSDLIKQ